jgi:hypothetical protein
MFPFTVHVLTPNGVAERRASGASLAPLSASDVPASIVRSSHLLESLMHCLQYS